MRTRERVLWALHNHWLREYNGSEISPTNRCFPRRTSGGGFAALCALRVSSSSPTMRGREVKSFTTDVAVRNPFVTTRIASESCADRRAFCCDRCRMVWQEFTWTERIDMRATTRRTPFRVPAVLRNKGRTIIMVQPTCCPIERFDGKGVEWVRTTSALSEHEEPIRSAVTLNPERRTRHRRCQQRDENGWATIKRRFMERTCRGNRRRARFKKLRGPRTRKRFRTNVPGEP